MAVVRYEAFEQLRRAIEDAVPELANHVFVGQAGPEDKACVPALVIDPVSWKFLPEQADEHFEPAPDRVVVNVGRHVGTVQLRLIAQTKKKRWELQEKISDLFISQEQRPGILVQLVSTIPEFGDFVIAWELEEDQWEDEKVFDQQFWSITTLNAVLPALVTRHGVWRIETLELGITHDFSSQFIAASFGDDVKVVRISETGALTPVP